MPLDFSAMRCLLFTPGTRPERFAKAIAASPDGVILDLEDAVAAADKDAARSSIGAFLAEAKPAVPVLVRINALGTRPALGDLTALVDGAMKPAALMLPKVEDPRDIVIVRSWLEGAPLPILAVIETLRGLNAADAIAAAVGEGGGIGMGGADLAAELGCQFGWEPLLMARSRIVAAAAMARIPAFDVPFLGLRDEAGLIAEASRVQALGFSAKLAIHPAQVGPIIAAFTPPAEAVAAAKRIVEAFKEAGGAAIQVDGKMVDIPLYQSALRTLRRSNA